MSHYQEDQGIAGKRDKPEEIVMKLRQVEVLQGQGVPIADAVRQIGVTEVTYYIYVRLSRCKSILKRSAWPVANIYPASAGCPERPNGESAHAHLYSWQASKASIKLRLVARRLDQCSPFLHLLANWLVASGVRSGSSSAASCGAGAGTTCRPARHVHCHP